MSQIANLIQKFIFSDSKRAMKFLSSRSDEWWEKKGQAKALTTFYETIEKVPVYRNFLIKRKVDPKEIKTFKDFQEKVPLTDKKSYILQNSLEDLCIEKLDKMYTVSMSSGTSGFPCFWPRLQGQDRMIPKFMEFSLLQNAEIDKKSTLLIVGLALGVYTAGEMMIYAMKELADQKKYSITVVTTGSEKESIVQVLKNLAPRYQQVLLWGYPSFLRQVIDEAEKEGIDFEKLNLKIGIGGEGFTKQWEDFIKEKLRLPKEDPARVMTVFGESVGGVMGISSPFTNLIRELAFQDSALFQELFGKAKGMYLLPILVEFNPLSVFIEEVHGELVITKRGAIPIIRYNLHDIGGVISHQKVLEILRIHRYDPFKLLREWNIEKEKIWTQPMFYVFGRLDNVISIDGANVYPESLEEIIYTNQITGVKGFKLGFKTDPSSQWQRFWVYLELKKNIVLTKEEEKRLKERAHDLILNHLLRVNNDFRKSYNDNPTVCDPFIEIYPEGTGLFVVDNKLTKRRLIEK